MAGGYPGINPSSSGDKGYLLSDDDAAVLRELVAWYRQRTPPLNPTQRPRSLDDPAALLPSTDIYIAYTLNGIPAMTGSPGTGSGSTLHPGRGLCDVWRIAPGQPGTGSVSDNELFRVGSVVNLLVKNVTFSAIPADSWFPVGRDKWGSWLALQGGGGGGGGTTASALALINTGTPNGDGTYDATLQIINPTMPSLTPSINIWFWDPNLPGALKAGDYFTVIYGGGMHTSGGSSRPLYVRDDFDLTVEYDDASTVLGRIFKLLLAKLDFVIAGAGTRGALINTRGWPENVAAGIGTKTVVRDIIIDFVNCSSTVFYEKIDVTDGLIQNLTDL